MSFASFNKNLPLSAAAIVIGMGMLAVLVAEAAAFSATTEGIDPIGNDSMSMQPTLIDVLMKGDSLLLAQGVSGDDAILSGTNDEKEKETVDEADGNEDTDDGESLHRFKGHVQLDNFISTYTEQEFGDAFVKNELKNYVDYRFGTPTLNIQLKNTISVSAHLFSDDINSRYCYSDRLLLGRNLRISSPSVELSFNEFYGNWEFGIVRFRLGNQVYSWGTTDAFNPTSYFNPFDLREFLFRDQDEMKIGVPSISSLIAIGDFSIEIVLVPIHVPMIMPERGNFWGFRYKEGPFPVYVDRPEELEPGIDGMGAGIQAYMNFFQIDIYLSLYHGPDKEPVLRPMGTLLVPNAPVSLLVSPQYYPFTAMGLALSRPVDKFIFQAEFSYSPDRTGVVEQPYTKALTLPFEIRKGHYISYSVGCNYMVPLGDIFSWHDGDAVLTVEWMQSRYLDDELMRPLFTDILVMQFRDSFFDSRFLLSITAIIDIADQSYSIVPRCEYRFKNDIALMVSYVFIESREDSFLGGFDNNDGITVRVRYEY